VSPPRIDGLRSDPGSLVADAAKTSFACHLALKAIDHIFATHLHESELSSEDDSQDPNEAQVRPPSVVERYKQ